MLSAWLYLMLFFAIFSFALWLLVSVWVVKTSKGTSALDSLWRNENRLNQAGLTPGQALMWKTSVIAKWIAVACGLLAFVLNSLPLLF